MMWIPALLVVLLSGWLLAALVSASTWKDRTADWLGTCGLAVLFGPGAASCGYFAALLTGRGSAALTWVLLMLLLVLCAGAWWRFRGFVTAGPISRAKFPYLGVLAGAVALGVVILTLDFGMATTANPNGAWDAGAIWNLRARFLAGGADLWHRAVSAEAGSFLITASHPGYPLFLSAFVGLLWSVNGSFAQEVPIAASLLIGLAVLALLISGLARRSWALGLLAGSILMGTELFAWQAPTQYADILLSLCFLSTLVLLDSAADARESPRTLLVMAGLAIGLAPWIKNEGQPFALAALAVTLWRFRGAAIWALAGSLPGLMATTALKLVTEASESLFPATFGEALGKVADPSRWGQASMGFIRAMADAGPWWAHPVLLVAAVALALGFIPSRDRRARWWLAAPAGIAFAAEFGVYLITTQDLTWQISTSATRLVMQLWPPLLWLLFSLLQPPEQYFPLAEPIGKPPQRGKR